MRFRLKALLGNLLDPAGPIGNIMSPSDVYKERLGLPVSSPHTLRIRAQKAPAFAEHALAPARIEPPDAIVPKGRIRQVSQFIEEHWTPIYASPKTTNIADCIRASQTKIGWRVTQVVRNMACTCKGAKFTLRDGELLHEICGRAAPAKCSSEDYIENVASLNIPSADDSYNVFMPTVPGNDAIMTPNGLARGGTRITQGRREYREKTKGFAHWDSGTMAERAKAQVELKAQTQKQLEQHTWSALKAMPSKMVFVPKSVARQRAEGVRK